MDEQELDDLSPVILALLDGALVDAEDLKYELGRAWHLGMILVGTSVKPMLDRLHETSCELLYAAAGADTAWVWLGNPVAGGLPTEDCLRSLLSTDLAVALGPAEAGLQGWRRTHMYAKAALPVAVRRGPGLFSCADVVLEAAILKDSSLAALLSETYLAPLKGLLRDRDDVVRNTLQAYFTSGQCVKTTAAQLRVDRRTVWYRLEQIALRLGYAPQERRAELELALRLARLTSPDSYSGERS